MTPAPFTIFNSCSLFLQIGGIETLLTHWYKATNPTQIRMNFGIASANGLNENFVSLVRQRGDVCLVGKGRNLLLQKISYVFQLYRFLKKNPPDCFLLHHSGITFLLLENWIAYWAGVKNRYLLLHGAWNEKAPFRKKFVRWCLRYTQIYCLTVSETAGKSFYGDLPFTKITTGICTQDFAFQPYVRAQMRAKLALESNFVIGHSGRFSPEKNHSFMIRIFQQIYQRDPSARLVLMGDGPLAPSIRRQVQQLHLENQVLFVGATQYAATYYQAFDVYVLPSLSEGFNLSVLEAQASGLPCFITDTLPAADVVGNIFRLSLKQPPAMWAKAILAAKSLPRKDAAAIVKQAGFDISCFEKNMEQLLTQS